jgi:hypothetical protein
LVIWVTAGPDNGTGITFNPAPGEAVTAAEESSV